MSNEFSQCNRDVNNIILRGEGKVTTMPDVAIVRLGVVTEGVDLTTIQSKNAMIVQNIIQILEQMGIDDISTFQYTIDKNYTFEDGVRIDNGFLVRNILEIKVYNMEQTGNIIDTAVEYGANIVDSISFEVSNPSIYYQEAINLAIMDGIDKARSIMNNLGININLIPAKIVENSTISQPPVPFFATRESNVSTPIQPGDKDIIANVTLEFVYL
jgi:uncharacterized protein